MKEAIIRKLNEIENYFSVSVFQGRMKIFRYASYDMVDHYAVLEKESLGGKEELLIFMGRYDQTIDFIMRVSKHKSYKKISF